MSDYFMNFQSNEPVKPFNSANVQIRALRHSFIFDAGGPHKVIPGAFFPHPGLPIREKLPTEMRDRDLGL